MKFRDNKKYRKLGNRELGVGSRFFYSLLIPNPQSLIPKYTFKGKPRKLVELNIIRHAKEATL